MGLFSFAAATSNKNIFISYRVSDTAGETGRLVDTLKQYFDDERIFIDIEKIDPGVDFTVAISRSLEACDVLLAIIGPNWQGLNTTTNKSRIQNPDDWVRIEIRTALQRNIPVVPILVDGGSLPSEEQLPDDLKPLVRRQAFEISNKRWKYDTEQLVRFLIKSVGIPPKRQGETKKSWWGQNYLWVLIVGVALIIISAIASNISDSESEQPINPSYNNGPETKPDPTPTHDTETELPIVHGTWQDANGLYYLNINQNGNALSITSYSLAGQQTGQGSGSISNGKVLLTVNVVDFGIINIDATLSGDGVNLNGTTKIENNGASYSEPLRLIKQQ
jgi:hypothetical protein